MGYLLIILFAVWNGLVIYWKHHNSKWASRKWHSVGWWARVAILLLMFQGFGPKWFSCLMNPVCCMQPIHAGFTTFLLVFGLSYWGYNYIINEINRWDWDYQKDMSRKAYLITLITWAVGTTAWIIWGDYIINHFLNT